MKAVNLTEKYKQPHTFMDINEMDTTEPITGSMSDHIVSAEPEEDDLTYAEMSAQVDQDAIGSEAVNAQYDLNEDSMAPEASEFMSGEKLKSVGSELGLAGGVEKSEGDTLPEPTEIKSVLDRMKELTKIMGNTPDVQWDGGSNNSITDTPKEVAPDDVVRSESGTGAPQIKTLKNPDAVSDGSSAPKSEGGESDSESDTSKPAEKKETPFAKKSEGGESKPADKKENPFAKKDEGESKPAEKKSEGESKPTEKKENPFAKKAEGESKPAEKPAEKKDEKDKVDEMRTHHIGLNHRNKVSEITEEDESEEIIDETELTDDEIIESEDTELMYESMIRYKNEPNKYLKFKSKIDEIRKEKALNESIRKMRNRF